MGLKIESQHNKLYRESIRIQDIFKDSYEFYESYESYTIMYSQRICKVLEARETPEYRDNIQKTIGYVMVDKPSVKSNASMTAASMSDASMSAASMSAASMPDDAVENVIGAEAAEEARQLEIATILSKSETRMYSDSNANKSNASDFNANANANNTNTNVNASDSNANESSVAEKQSFEYFRNFIMDKHSEERRRDNIAFENDPFLETLEKLPHNPVFSSDNRIDRPVTYQALQSYVSRTHANFPQATQAPVQASQTQQDTQAQQAHATQLPLAQYIYTPQRSSSTPVRTHDSREPKRESKQKITGTPSFESPRRVVDAQARVDFHDRKDLYARDMPSKVTELSSAESTPESTPARYTAKQHRTKSPEIKQTHKSPDIMKQKSIHDYTQKSTDIMKQKSTHEHMYTKSPEPIKQKVIYENTLIDEYVFINHQKIDKQLCMYTRQQRINMFKHKNSRSDNQVSTCGYVISDDYINVPVYIGNNCNQEIPPMTMSITAGTSEDIIAKRIVDVREEIFKGLRCGAATTHGNRCARHAQIADVAGCRYNIQLLGMVEYDVLDKQRNVESFYATGAQCCLGIVAGDKFCARHNKVFKNI